MDVFGPPPPELFRVDDLLDFSNDELFSPKSTTSTTDSNHLHLHHHHHHHSFSDNTTAATYFDTTNNPNLSFTDELGVPSDDVAELEWLSTFVDDSFTEFPANSFTGTVNPRPDSSFHGRPRTKRSRSTSIATTNTTWTSSTESQATNPNTHSKNNTPRRRESSVSTSSRDRSSSADVPRRCTHCASEKTPQWRTGPMGPKTLCNACGVRFKSGRLVPEYRPAASPTFVLTQHSNSHRKVLELRRQKEMMLNQQQHQVQMQVVPPPQQQQQQEQQMYGLHHFQVC